LPKATMPNAMEARTKTAAKSLQVLMDFSPVTRGEQLYSR
jgi:hypothetical protein